MSNFKRIMVATDFSAVARAALDTAIGLARVHEARVHLVHAVETFAVPFAIPLSVQQLISDRVQEQLSELERVAQGGGVPVTSHWQVGRAWEVVKGEQAREAADVLVLGTHGQTAYARALLGSTADQIIRTFPGAVLAVRGDVAAHAWTDSATVLVATDFSEEAERATSAAVRILEALPGGGRLVMLHVCQLPVVYEVEAVAPVLVSEMEEDQLQAAQRLETLAVPRRTSKIAVETMVREGPPASLIVAEAEAAAADMIVLGTHGRSGIGHFFLGSTARWVVHHAHCPVLTVHHPSAQELVQLSA